LLGILETWTLQADYLAPSAQVSWVAVVVVLFPFLIPASTRTVLAASLAAAAMQPLAMAVAFGMLHRAWPETGVTVSYILPQFLCALLAWAPTSAIQGLVQRARTLGSYELSERLGSGGMGEVWRARHRLLARPAAVKLIKPEMLGAKDAASRELVLARFEKEARVTANLDSPHTVELYDFGVSSKGELFYVMELLEGLDADTLVDEFGPLPSERVTHLLMQACDSLADAHQRGLVHRDVKPANLFVSRKGVEFDFLKVLDFGLVKRWRSEDDEKLSQSLAGLTNLGQTGVGQIVGTPAFLAPEAAIGQDAVDHRADLYALGCVGYWLLTGCMVFDDDNAIAMAVAHVSKTPKPPSSRIDAPIEPELERIVLACLEKDRERRPQSAEELRERLAAIRFAEPWSRERSASWWHEHRPAPAPTATTIAAAT
jgi:serine/threonine protein kinase